MKKKISFILLIVLILVLLIGSNVRAEDQAIDFKDGWAVSKKTESEASYRWQIDPFQIDTTKEDGTVGFYCFNRNMHFSPYRINTQITTTIDKDGNTTVSGDSKTSRMGDISNSKYQLSYIFAQNFNGLTFNEKINKAMDIQRAIWNSKEGSEVYSNIDLYGNAMAYKNYVNSGATVNIITNKEFGFKDVGLENDYGYIGPIYISYNEGKYGSYTYKPTFSGKVNEVDNGIYVTDNRTGTVYKKELYIKNGDNTYKVVNNSDIANNTEYYLKVKKNQNGYYDIHIYYQDIYAGWIAQCDNSNNSNNQSVIAGKFTLPQKIKTVRIEHSDVNKININLNKVDNEGNKITTDSKFKITAKQGNNYIKNDSGADMHDYEYNGNSTITLIPNRASENDQVYVTIAETQAPQGYKKLENPINIVYVCNADGYWNAKYCPGYLTKDQVYKKFLNIDEKLTEGKTEELINFIEDNDNFLYKLYWFNKQYNNIQTFEEFFEYLKNDKEQVHEDQKYMSIIGDIAVDTQLKQELDASVQEKLQDIREEEYNKYKDKFGENYKAWEYREYSINPFPHTYYITREDNLEDKFTVEQDERENNTVTNCSLYISNNPDLPNINLNLIKVNYIDQSLIGAKFKVTAMQNKTEIFNDEQTENYSFDIEPVNKFNIFILIEETEAPENYAKIEPICAMYYYHDESNSWWPKYVVTPEDWTDSGFDDLSKIMNDYKESYSGALDEDTLLDVFKNLNHDLDENSEEFVLEYNNWLKKQEPSYHGWTNPAGKEENGDRIYRSVNNNDKIRINSQTIYKGALVDYIKADITIYDKIELKELQLVKVDALTGKRLIGAKFNFKVTNMNGVEDKSVWSRQTNEEGIISIENIIMKDEDNVNGLTITITEIEAPNGYVGLSQPIELRLKHKDNGFDFDFVNEPPTGVTASGNKETGEAIITIPNTPQPGTLSGKVWLDGQTGIKPAVGPNGLIDSNEQGIDGISVKLLKDGNIIDTQTTKNGGNYKFENVLQGQKYQVQFTYDGINYEDTLYYRDVTPNGKSKAKEVDSERATFNARFTTITSAGSNDGTALSYNYQDKKSTLITTDEQGLIDSFKMNAYTEEILIEETPRIDFGLVKRGTDLALSTDIVDVVETINGEEQKLLVNTDDNTVTIDAEPTNERNITYNVNLYTSDYNYRIRDYVNSQEFTEKDYMNGEMEGVNKSGNELQVYVKYKINLQNQCTKTVKVNELVYNYDSKYEVVYNKETKSIECTLAGETLNVQDSNNQLIIKGVNGITLTDGQTKTIEVTFKVKQDEAGLYRGEFNNTAEITSYSTEEGLIDCDSQPGNLNTNGFEDDSDKARTFQLLDPNGERILTGYVWDNKDTSHNSKVDGVIVQLIELKEINGKKYEYIWQETVSGSGTGKMLSDDGKSLKDYTYTKSTGTYKFQGFIPGNYIVRFIYGDGTTYDLTENVIKYNGQDYKSVATVNDHSNEGEKSKAIDNEARRLETMAYSVNVDGKKGALLKLLDVQDVNNLNLTEIELIKEAYKDVYKKEINEVTSDILNNLLKDETLYNTWMCAETSTIGVNLNTTSIPNINLGLEERPQTNVSLQKNMVGFKLTAANGQPLVNAYSDGNEEMSIQGLQDNLQVIKDNYWKYEVSPTELNTVVDKAKLEYVYDYVITNESEDDFLSATLCGEYEDPNINYEAKLQEHSQDVKTQIMNVSDKYVTGTYLGQAYYTGNTGESKVKTEVTNIRDYVNNDLSFVKGDNVELDTSVPEDKKYNILDDEYGIKQIKLDTVLTTNVPTGKMEPQSNTSKYVVTLGKKSVSSTGKLDYDTYIAEVMVYTNAAGRRTTKSSPANAEIVSTELRLGLKHEPDEEDSERMQISASTGEDKQTNYNLIISIFAVIAVVAAGIFVTKKYIIK